MPRVPVKIFVCYKKILEKTEAGRSVVQHNTYAETIAEILNSSSEHFVAWLDDAEIPGGIDWENTIYENLLDSDVLLVVIGPGTSQSEWVKREIALATAFGITVYPVGVGMTMDQLMSELGELKVSQLQGRVSQNAKLATRAAFLAEIKDELKRAAQRTASKQTPILTRLLNRHAISPPRKALDVQRAASFAIPHAGGKIALHVAAGDVAQIYGVDALVNSENNYMQMARFFESRTISSMLRRRGAQLREGKFEDTIQREIDWVLEGRARPLQPGECVATSAGGHQSDLVFFNG